MPLGRPFFKVTSSSCSCKQITTIIIAYMSNTFYFYKYYTYVFSLVQLVRRRDKKVLSP